jgi:hypothetical protein
MIEAPTHNIVLFMGLCPCVPTSESLPPSERPAFTLIVPRILVPPSCALFPSSNPLFYELTYSFIMSWHPFMGLLPLFPRLPPCQGNNRVFDASTNEWKKPTERLSNEQRRSSSSSSSHLYLLSE